MNKATCCVDDCESPAHARGWCNKHWKRWRKYGSPTTLLFRERGAAPEPCLIEGCDRPNNPGGKGWCSKHYHRYHRWGDPLADKTKVKPDFDRICLIDDCERLAYIPGAGRGWCPMHFHRWQRYGDTAERPPRARNICIIEGCGSFVVGHGLCARHYSRAMTHGDPTARYDGEVVDGKRICPRCKDDLPLDRYGVSASRSDGHGVYCKLCTREIAAAWREANPGYIQPPPDPTKVKEWSRLWREANPDQVRAQAARYRARKYHPGAEMFSPRGVFDRDGWICGICTEAIDPDVLYPDPMSVSLDHIVPLSKSGHHTRANTQASHLLCNMRKHNTLVA